MISLEPYIAKDGDTFYLDVSEIDKNAPEFQGIVYEDTDKIRWKWENKKYIGTLKQVGYNKELFVLRDVKEL